MKRLTAILMLTFALAAFSSAVSEVITYNDSWAEEGYNLTNQSPTGVEVVFSIEKMNIQDLVVEGQTMKVVGIPGIYLPNNAGAPNLPGGGRFIAIPHGATAQVQILDSRVEVIENIDIAPAPPIPLESDNSPPVYEKDAAIYSRDAYYPDSPVKLSKPSKMRGVDYVTLGITPFQYNPVTRELLVYRDLRVRVDFLGGNGRFGEDRLRSRYWEPILQGHLINYASLPEVDFNRVPSRFSETEDVEYLIIVPDDPDFIAWGDTLRNWRTLQGIRTGVATLTEVGGNNWFAIEEFIDNAYYTWEIPPVAVLLLSDYENSGEGYGITSPEWNNYCISDNIYADVEGNDDLPDLAIARITAQNAADLESTIGKMLEYERTPPTAANFYDEPLIAGGWQTDRWFILCCEVIYGFLETRLGKHPVREYAGRTGAPDQWSTNENTWMIIEYFGPRGLGYIPETPEHLIDWSGSAEGINAAINSGSFIVQHRDHGEIDGWSSPSYHNSDLTALHNDMYPFVFSMNCLTGKYDNYSECFAEAFHRPQQRALGITAASQVSYSFVNDAYTWGVYDCIWQDFDPYYSHDPTGPSYSRLAFANAYGKYYLEASSWPYNPDNKVHTYHLFHHHGDAFMTLCTEVPQYLTVTHDAVMYAGVKEFTVTADEGAIVALTVNGEVIGVAEGTGSPYPIPIAPQQAGETMIVTVTKMNCYRYSEEVPIVPTVGPHVVYDSLAINDTHGNNNGLLDYGEDVFLSVTVKNIGTTTAHDVNVVISAADQFTTVIDSLEFYGDIEAGATKVVTDGFEIETSPLVPDLHSVTFATLAISGDGSWTSHFSIVAHAPVVEFHELAIIDPSGNGNGKLDPGETVDFHVTVKNNGTSDVGDLSVELGCDHPGITVSTDPAFIPSLPSGGEETVVFADVSAEMTVPNATDVEFDLDFVSQSGYANSDEFSVHIGDARYLPSGPDEYGYRAYDMWETIGAPEYDWFEIAPMAGGPGRVIELSNDQTVRVELPFTFKFYNHIHSYISICSNGWIVIGRTTNTSRYNSQIPYRFAPNNIVAIYWCNLNPEEGGQVCCYYDGANHRCIVEWYQVPHYTNIGPNTFQVILLDPAHYSTPSGDGEIIMLYKELASLSQYSSVGIEDFDGYRGLQYLFNEVYADNAMPIEPPFALRFTTAADGVTNIVLTMTPVDPPVVIPPAGGYFDYHVVIDNIGASAIDVDVWTDVVEPGGRPFGPLLLRPGKVLPRNSVTERTITQYVPARAPSGEYIYRGYTGTYPDAAEVWESFTFTKEEGDFTGLARYTEWTVTGWDGEALASLGIPEEFCLAQSYPNPFNARTTIKYQLPVESHVKLEVYNLLGQKVATLADEKQAAGYRSVIWDASEVSSGLYLYRLTAGDYTDTRRMMLVK